MSQLQNALHPAIQLLFWVCVLLIVHTWLFYPGVIRLLSYLLKGSNGQEASTALGSYTPGVSVVLPVHNAERSIISKIDNLRALEYPAQKIEILVVSDGSTDSTVEKAMSAFGDQIKVIALPQNRGKSAAQNRGIAEAIHPLLLLTDVEATMDREALKRMVVRFSDPKVGCVGSNVIYQKDGWEPSGSHTAYWRLEESSRVAESALGVLISVCGSAFAVRKNLVRPLDHDTGDDFIVPLDVALAGQRTVFADDALVYDHWPSTTFVGELKTRRRITLRNFLGLMRRRQLLNPFRYPWLSVSLLSHKVLRWLSPVLMILVLFSNGFLYSSGWLCRDLLYLQAVFYATALAGVIVSAYGRHIPGFSTCGAFLWANFGMLLGLYSLARGRRIRAYQPRG